MRGRGGVIAGSDKIRQAAWAEPMTDKMNKHARFVWIKRGGNSKTSGSGASGHRATPRALLARALAERPGVADHVTKRQAAAVARRALPPAIIWGA